MLRRTGQSTSELTKMVEIMRTAMPWSSKKMLRLPILLDQESGPLRSSMVDNGGYRVKRVLVDVGSRADAQSYQDAGAWRSMSGDRDHVVILRFRQLPIGDGLDLWFRRHSSRPRQPTLLKRPEGCQVERPTWCREDEARMTTLGPELSPVPSPSSWRRPVDRTLSCDSPYL